MTHLDLFSGYGGFSLALERCGFSTVAFAEVESFACRVLAHHWPTVPNLGDVTKINGADIRADIVTAGFPCQDVSVAGKRAGLKGARSGLFWEVIRIVKEMGEAGHGPTCVVLENVPGLLSSDAGRDFATVLSGLAELRPHDIAWRVMDAQFFGVPQRRRRVFLVADFGGERAAEILALTEGVQRDSPTGREAGEGVAGSLGGGTGSRGWSSDTERMSFIPIQSVNMVREKKQNGIGIADETAPMYSLTGRDQHAVAGTLNSSIGRGTGAAHEADFLVAAPLTAKAAKGTGGPSGDECQNLVCGALLTGYTTHGHGRAGVNDQAVASGQVVAFAENQRAELRTSDVSPQLSCAGGKPGSGYPAVQTQMQVRRLTPTECEKLQGLPENFTALPGAADGPRYRILGNGVAIPVVEWIGRRIAAALEQKEVAA